MIAPAKVFWAFEEDILNRSWLEWLCAHISFSNPLHRYKGELTILNDILQLVGKDKKTKAEILLEIHKYEIEQSLITI